VTVRPELIRAVSKVLLPGSTVPDQFDAVIQSPEFTCHDRVAAFEGEPHEITPAITKAIAKACIESAQVVDRRARIAPTLEVLLRVWMTSIVVPQNRRRNWFASAYERITSA
jgi:hypothetical protein